MPWRGLTPFQVWPGGCRCLPCCQELLLRGLPLYSCTLHQAGPIASTCLTIRLHRPAPPYRSAAACWMASGPSCPHSMGCLGQTGPAQRRLRRTAAWSGDCAHAICQFHKPFAAAAAAAAFSHTWPLPPQGPNPAPTCCPALPGAATAGGRSPRSGRRWRTLWRGWGSWWGRRKNDRVSTTERLRPVGWMSGAGICCCGLRPIRCVLLLPCCRHAGKQILWMMVQWFIWAVAERQSSLRAACSCGRAATGHAYAAACCACWDAQRG